MKSSNEPTSDPMPKKDKNPLQIEEPEVSRSSTTEEPKSTEGEKKNSTIVEPHALPQEEKRKGGYYLRESILQRLDFAMPRINAQFEDNVTKSEVVEAAIDILLSEWEKEDGGRLKEWLRRRLR